jgi:hypothetical protein
MRGLLKFSADERGDDRWRLREAIILSEVERDSVVKLDMMVHVAESAAAQYVDSNVFKHHHDKATTVFHKVRAMLQPYKYSAALSENLMDSLTQAWINEFGDPDGPAVHELIRKLENGEC